MSYPTFAELEAGLAAARLSPKEAGTLEMIVRRPGVGEREVLDEGQLDTETGLVGDTWFRRGVSQILIIGPQSFVGRSKRNLRQRLSRLVMAVVQLGKARQHVGQPPALAHAQQPADESAPAEKAAPEGSAPTDDAAVEGSDTTADDSATTADNDYVEIAIGQATFDPSETTTTIDITVNGDTTPETDETFFVNLSGPVNATIGDGQGVCTIVPSGCGSRRTPSYRCHASSCAVWRLAKTQVSVDPNISTISPLSLATTAAASR